MKRRYDDQLFARCSKADRRKTARAARAMGIDTSEFIRRAVSEKAERIVTTEEAHSGAYKATA